MDDRWVTFARSMAPMAAPMAGVLSQIVNADAPTSKPVRVLDIAAGHGAYGIKIAKNNPDVPVAAIDWPAVLGAAEENDQNVDGGGRFLTFSGRSVWRELFEEYDQG